LRRQLTLDRWITQATDRPLNQLDPPTQIALRLGLFQLLYLDRVPAHAAVDETVEALKQRRRSAVSLVNAVLRRVADPKRRPPAPVAQDEADALAMAGACPPWIARRFATIAARAGVDPAPLMASLVIAAHPTVRVRPPLTRDLLLERLRALGIDATPTAHVASGVKLRRAGAVTALPGFSRELIAQDEAAQWAVALAAGEHGPTLDACAAPGGKTIALHDMGHAPLTAMDVSESRFALLQRSLGEAEVAATTLCASAEAPPFAPGSFATVVLDAPCTGSGTLRRHPELKLRMAPEDITRLAALQAHMLHALAPLVRPGGALIYSVCSVFPEEGEAQVSAFVRDHGFTCEDSVYTFRYMEEMDGFYAARLRRPASA
jgi:16S rRNA (cytosine967-C5)-methyltransferase